MVPSKLGDWNRKGLWQRKYPLLLKAIHPAVKVLVCFMLTGWQTKIY